MNVLWSSKKRVLFFGLPLSFTKYTLTDEKFLLDSGFFNSSQEEVRLYRVVDLSLSRSFAQKIFGLGTITLKTKDETLKNVELKNVKDSVNVKELISDAVENERVKKRVSTREYMADDNDDHYDDDDDDDDNDDND